MAENKLVVEDAVVSAEALKKAEEYIEEEEGAINKLPGRLGIFATALAVFMSLFHLYAAYGIMPTHVLRGIHVAFILFLGFLLFPVSKRFRHQVRWWDWAAAALSLVIVGNMLFGGDAFLERAIDPTALDKVLGIALLVLVLEAARRTSGWIMPAICVGFLVYAVIGQYLPPPWTHYGMDTGRIVGHMYMTLEGIFGVAIDVSSSLIILFTIYGAFLQYSGAGKFFIDFSFAAMGGKPTGAGRTIVLASFLLGGPSGSGVATTVTLGNFRSSSMNGAVFPDCVCPTNFDPAFGFGLETRKLGDATNDCTMPDEIALSHLDISFNHNV